MAFCSLAALQELAEGETTHKPDFFVDNGAKANVEEMHRSSNPIAVRTRPSLHTNPFEVMASVASVRNLLVPATAAA